MLTIETLERRQQLCRGVFIVNFEHISHLVVMFSIAGFEQLNAASLWIWEATFESCSVKRSYAMFYKKLETKKKVRTLTIIRLFHKKQFQDQVQVGFFNICQRFDGEKGV